MTSGETAVAVWPGALATVSVKVVGAVSAAVDLAVPEVTAPMPLSTIPAPEVKVGRRWTGAPKSGLVLSTARLLATGRARTFTVTVEVLVGSAALAAVRR